MIQPRKKRVAILVADGFEQSHMTRPRIALEEAGVLTYLICPDPLLAVGWDQGDYSETFMVDRTLNEAIPDDFDSLLLPGGLLSIDLLRQEPKVTDFVQHFISSAKPVTAIGHAAHILVDVGCLQNRVVTSVPSIRRDLVNAGATWKDSEFVVDAHLLTARSVQEFTRYKSRFIQHCFMGSPGVPAMAA